VGPDLTPLTTRPADYWLTQILDPNRAVEDRYREYLVLTTDGRQLQGLLAEETGAGLTLLAPEGKQYHLSRDQIEQLRSSGKSLMPEGIERDLPPQEMADLVAFLRASSPPPKEIPGNRPEVVQPFVADGSLRLLATNARIYGPTLTLEEKYRNLGWWQSPEDHAIWTFEVPPDGAGSYRVTLDYACANAAAGNVVVIEVAGQTLSAVVPGTGSWDEFRGWTLGTVQLAAGRGELVVRSGGPIKQALLDLRSVRLTPVR
jgi:putative heme-binding domain-containing protein